MIIRRNLSNDRPMKRGIWTICCMLALSGESAVPQNLSQSNQTSPGTGPVRIRLLRSTPSSISNENSLHVHSSPRHVTVQSPSSRETFLGASIESPGDITGDGFPDLLIAASRYANGRESRAGAIYLLLGSAAGIQPNAIWSYSIPLANAQVGRRMTSAGDINGDGRRDLVTSSIPKERIGRKLGWLHVFYGMTNSYPIEADWRYLPKPKPASFVPSVALADINRDGFSDLIVGNPAASSTYSNEGCILVFLGGKNGLRDEPETLIYGNVEGAAFGATVTAAGDINGDGGPDLLVGALTHPVGGRPRCAVFLFTGNADGLTSSPQWSAPGSTTMLSSVKS